MSTYNKVDNQGTLMGNWVEEEALRRDTGYSRYKTWTPKEGMGVSHPRVIAHTDAVDAKDYRASSKASSFADFAVPPNVGPRERRRLEELHAQAKVIKQAAKDADQDNDPTARESTNQASYKAHDPAYVAHASDPGAEASPGIGINLQARAAVLKLKQWLQASPGLHDVGLPLLEKDALQVFTYLDKEQVGRITWVALFDLLDA
ncbi:hypothetical protein DYB32_009520 [Aphanomyces invadans]|uniref:Uncharacterized protein n=1 Tax=Aphanomyces invadans TaxID=157072 RepID=A0A418AI56_9STRA|nr:hypothetical protein DYB32_009520 [Aphanomyces invadans]